MRVNKTKELSGQSNIKRDDYKAGWPYINKKLVPQWGRQTRVMNNSLEQVKISMAMIPHA